MTAIARAEQMFRDNLPDEPFIMRLGLYLRHGFVVCAPTLFTMWRPVQVRTDRPYRDQLEAIKNPENRFESPNAWYVDMTVGRLRHLPQLMPFELPYICFCRKFRNELKVYRTSELFRRIQSWT
jgi:hypothetical protein